MYETVEMVKNFVLSKLFSDEAEKFNLPKIAKVVCGYTDISRVESKCVCVIVPERTEGVSEGDLTDGRRGDTVTVSFILRGAEAETLVRQSCEYAEAFRRAVTSDWSMGGSFLAVDLRGTEYFPNAGTTDGTCAISETQIFCERSEGADFSDIDPFA